MRSICTNSYVLCRYMAYEATHPKQPHSVNDLCQPSGYSSPEYNAAYQRTMLLTSNHYFKPHPNCSFLRDSLHILSTSLPLSCNSLSSHNHSFEQFQSSSDVKVELFRTLLHPCSQAWFSFSDWSLVFPAVSPQESWSLASLSSICYLVAYAGEFWKSQCRFPVQPVRSSLFFFSFRRPPPPISPQSATSGTPKYVGW
jgi:hypothetical protein